MLYCQRCQKPVVIVGISLGAATEEEIREFNRGVEAEGRLILFNPPPFGPHLCPECGASLRDLAGAVEDS